MSIPDHDTEPSPETPVEDYLEQQEPVLEPDHGAADDDETILDRPAVPGMAVEANEADLIEQSLEVPLDEDYPNAEP
jgi:hypothetical protein